MENNNLQNEEIVNVKMLPEVTQFNIHSVAYLTFLECQSISLGAKLVWLHLDARAGINRFLWFGKEKIYNTLGMSKNTYAKYTKELEKIGGIIRIKRFDKKHGEKQTDIFIVCEFNQVDKKFITPPNIDEINKTLKTKFENSALISNEPETIENKAMHKNCARLKNPKDMKFKSMHKICAKAMNKIYAQFMHKNCASPERKKCAHNKRKSFNKLKIYNKRKEENKRKDIPSAPILSGKDIINSIDSYCKDTLSKVSYDTWIKDNIEKSYVENDVLFFPVKDEFTQGLIKSRYLKIFQAIFKGNIEIKIN